MELNWDALRVILQLVELLAIAVVAFYAWTQGRSKANKAEIDALRADHGGRLNVHGERITRLESEINSLPDRHDIGELHSRINETLKQLGGVAESVGKMTGVLNAQTVQVKQLMDFHLRGDTR